MDFSPMYLSYDQDLIRKRESTEKSGPSARDLLLCKPGIKSFVCQETEEEESQQPSSSETGSMDGFKRMERCMMALDALDQQGWKRSFFQKKFHNAFMAACARAFFKMDPPGSFQRAFQKILEINSWNNLNQEILISTPRRFGKTISVSMFAAGSSKNIYIC